MSVLHLDDLDLGPGDVLILVDVQNDFLPGGAMAVPRGHEVIAPLNRAIAAFRRRRLPIFATRDWHPADHRFRNTLPRHCVMGTRGARFAGSLALSSDVHIVSKGADGEAYSGFQGTALKDRLRAVGARHVFCGGLATEYAVRATCIDALDRDFTASILLDAVRALDAQPGDGDRAIAELLALGVLPSEAGAHHVVERRV